MYYTKRWAYECCQAFLGIPDDLAAQVCGREGQALMQILWDADPAQFYEHPLQLLRQEWWHMESGRYNHAGFFAALPANARMLDYGCGTGEVVRPWLMHQNAGQSTVYLFDTSANCRAYLAHKYGSRGSHGQIWLEVLSDVLMLAHESLDALICTDVLEHVPNPMDVQAALWALLKPGGHALLKMETAYPHAGHLQEAVQQFPQWKQWVQENTEIIEVETYVWCCKP